MDLASIIALVSQHNADPSTVSETVETEIVETVIGRNLPKPQRGSKAVVTAPIHVTPAAPSMTAQSFIVAMRKARSRDESIEAIVAYTGLPRNVVASNFGTHDQEARAKAQRELRGFKVTGPTREEKRSAERSMSGFVAGMPRHDQKLLANLKAREQAAVEAMIDATTEQDRAAHKAMLDQVRAAIAALV